MNEGQQRDGDRDHRVGEECEPLDRDRAHLQRLDRVVVPDVVRRP
jgi:hypothetical protein